MNYLIIKNSTFEDISIIGPYPLLKSERLSME